MDHRRFDHLTRALGGATSRRSALAALAALAGVGAAGRDAGARKRRRKCDPACPAGQTCEQGTCRCANGGTACGASCCTGGQRCQNGACVTPAACIAFGQPCKNAGRPCCAGFACGSGQGGKGDVACYAPAGAACATTADCVYDSTCKDGVCIANPPAPACTPTFQPTGIPVQDGNLLAGYWNEANRAGGGEIFLASGTYTLDVGASLGPTWEAGSLTVAACPGETVTLTIQGNQPYLGYGLFNIAGGNVTLTDLIFDGRDGEGATGAAYSGIVAVGGSTVTTLNGCTVKRFPGGGVISRFGVVNVNGGDYRGNVNSSPSLSNSFWGLNGGGFQCTGGPLAGQCSGLTGPMCAACGCGSCDGN